MREDNVSFLALRRLTEQAWDEGDQERLERLSAAVDAITAQRILQAGEEQAACE